MAEINVRRLGEKTTGWIFEVDIKEGESMSVHIVEVGKDDYQRLASGRTPEELVRKSFEFLLEREPKESILKKFNLTEISSYFPEYESEVRRG